jgi:hypothetical protein
MPSVTFTYPDELQELVHSAACSQYGYLEEIENPEFITTETISESNPKMIPNPVSKGEFTRQVVIDFISEVVKSYSMTVAKEQAIEGALAQWDAIVASSENLITSEEVPN